MIIKYTGKDAGKQKFVIGNFYWCEMTDYKDIKVQIKEYHRLQENLKAKNINLQEEFVSGLFIKNMSKSWKDYKQQL